MWRWTRATPPQPQRARGRPPTPSLAGARVVATIGRCRTRGRSQLARASPRRFVSALLKYDTDKPVITLNFSPGPRDARGARISAHTSFMAKFVNAVSGYLSVCREACARVCVRVRACLRAHLCVCVCVCAPRSEVKAPLLTLKESADWASTIWIRRFEYRA